MAIWRKLSILATATILAGCSGRTPDVKKPPAPETSAPAPTAEPAPAADCPKLKGDADAAYRELQALPKNAPWQKRQSLAFKAARAGHAEGQARAGGMTFSDLYQGDAPRPDSAEDREAYVAALTNLFTGAFRGSEYGRGYAPDMAAIVDTGKLPAKLEQPFEEVPRQWLEEAMSGAREWLACHDKSALK